MSEYYEELKEFFAGCGNQVVPDEYLRRVMNRITAAPHHVDDPAVRFRASKIGRPFVLQLVERWYGGKRQMTAANCLAMCNGLIIQEVAAELLTLCGVKFKQEARLENIGVAGHADFIVEADNGEVLIIECKSMAPHVFTQFRSAPTDNYGYISQLAFYCDTYEQDTGKKPVPCFLMFNRGTSAFHLLRVADHAIEERANRYKQTIPKLLTVDDYDIMGMLRVVTAPPAAGGKLPTSMASTKWHQYFYANRDGWWDLRNNEDIIERFSELAAQRADRQPLQYRGE